MPHLCDQNWRTFWFRLGGAGGHREGTRVSPWEKPRLARFPVWVHAEEGVPGQKRALVPDLNVGVEIIVWVRARRGQLSAALIFS